jgi:hypothetical protein
MLKTRVLAKDHAVHVLRLEEQESGKVSLQPKSVKVEAEPTGEAACVVKVGPGHARAGVHWHHQEGGVVPRRAPQGVRLNRERTSLHAPSIQGKEEDRLSCSAMCHNKHKGS